MKLSTMPKLNKSLVLLALIILLAIVLRFYKLGSVPPGFHQDEVSQAYNAFAIGTTGHDRYGQYFPILFRSFGSYQPPVYTYLGAIPILLLGNTIFAARFLSALSGVLIVILTYLIVREFSLAKRHSSLAILAALVVATSPWAILFSRRVVEGNLGLSIFLTAFYLFLRSLKVPKLFPIAALVMGVSTQAYYSERVIAILFIPIFLATFWKKYSKHKKLIFLGFVLFGLTQLPHLWILTSGAYARRFAQVSFFSQAPSGLPGLLYISQQIIGHYISYISPKNLFADTGSSLARVSPDLGVFYSWLFIPFLVGLVAFIRQKGSLFFKALAILIPISLIPASLTGDLFYPLRILEFLWIIAIIISLGIITILESIKNKVLGVSLLGILTIYSLAAFYVSFVVLLKYEINEYVGQAYIDLNRELEFFGNKKIVIDSFRDYAIGARIAYLRKYDPNKLAATLRPQLTSGYYSSEVGIQEVYKIDNIITRPFILKEDAYSKNTILVGDTLAISEQTVKQLELTPLFDIKAADSRVVLKAYLTHPELLNTQR